MLSQSSPKVQAARETPDQPSGFPPAPSSRESLLPSAVLLPVPPVARLWVPPKCILETASSLVSLLVTVVEFSIAGTLDQPDSKKSRDL